MAREKVCGIYCIENLINHKRYIGQSSDIEKRWYEHQRVLNKNEHCNLYLQRSWNMHGQSNFRFYILELCDVDLLCDLEMYYINMFHTNCSEYGYNETAGGEGTRGWHWSEEQKKAISERQKGKQISDETRRKMAETWANLIAEGYCPRTDHLAEYIEAQMKQIDCYDKFGNFLCTYNSIHDAARTLCVEATNISKVLLKKHNHCQYMVFYYHDGNIVPKSEIILRACRNPIFSIDDNGELLELFSDSKDVERKLQVDASYVIKICREKMKSIHGYRFVYATKDLLDEKYGCTGLTIQN